jgi:hypothetical protein
MILEWIIHEAKETCKWRALVNAMFNGNVRDLGRGAKRKKKKTGVMRSLPV